MSQNTVSRRAVSHYIFFYHLQFQPVVDRFASSAASPRRRPLAGARVRRSRSLPSPHSPRRPAAGLPWGMAIRKTDRRGVRGHGGRQYPKGRQHRQDRDRRTHRAPGRRRDRARQMLALRAALQRNRGRRRAARSRVTLAIHQSCVSQNVRRCREFGGRSLPAVPHFEGTAAAIPTPIPQPNSMPASPNAVRRVPGQHQLHRFGAMVKSSGCNAPCFPTAAACSATRT